MLEYKPGFGELGLCRQCGKHTTTHKNHQWYHNLKYLNVHRSRQVTNECGRQRKRRNGDKGNEK